MKQKLFSVLVVAIVLFSFLPTLYELKRSSELPGDRSFELIHNYITDYNFYISRIREGWDGRWTVIERYTNEFHEGSLVQEFYLLLGKAGTTIPDPNMAVTYVYQAARLVSSFLLLALTVWAATHMFPVFFWSLLAFLMAVFSSGWPVFVPIGESWRFGGYMSWFTVMDILQRISFLPHVLVGQSLVLFLVIAGNDAKTMQKTGNWIFLGFLSLLLGIIFPPGLVFVGAAYGIGIVMDTVWNWDTYVKRHRVGLWLNECVMPRAIIGCISVPALLYYAVTLSIYPWKRLVDFGLLHPVNAPLIEYVKALGPVLPFGFFGLIVAIWKKDWQVLGAMSWVLTWILLYWVFSFIPQQSSLRFAEMAPHIPLAFFMVYLAKTIMEWANRRQKVSYIGIFALVIPLLSIVMGMGIMYSYWEWNRDFVNQKVGAGWPVISMNNYIVYPTKGFIDGLTFINYQTPPESVILSDLTAGNYIPARTGRRVYVGHDGSIRKEEKMVLVEQFFSGNMKAKDAYAWLKREGITYIFYGPQEKEQGKDIDIASVYPYIRQVFVNPDVIIFQVQ